MTISPYQKQLSNFGYIKPPKYNLELELQVLQHKQNTYDKNYKFLQGLKAQALNIQFINKEAKGKVDEFNNQISSTFQDLEGDFGDLSQNNVAEKYIDMFDQFQNTGLIGLHKKETEYFNTIKDINRRKKSKKPGEAGYHPINEMVYRLDLQDYADLSMEDAKESSVDEYVPYVDVGKLQQEALLKVPETEIEYEEIDLKTGRKTIVKEKGRDIDASNQIASQINRDNSAQFKVQAKYLYKAGALSNPEILTEQVNQYNNSILQQRMGVEKQRESLNKSYKGKAKDDAYHNANQAIENRLAELKTYNIADLTEEQTIGIISNNINNEVRQGAVAAYAPQSQSITTEMDSVYKFAKEFGLKAANYSLDVAKFEETKKQNQLDNLLSQEELRLKGLKIDADGKVTKAEGFIGGVDTSEGTSKFSTEQITDFAEKVTDEARNVMIQSHSFDKGSLKLEGTDYGNILQKELKTANNKLAVLSRTNTDPSILMDIFGGDSVEGRNEEIEALQIKIKNLETLVSTPLTKEVILSELNKNKNAFDNDPVLSQNYEILAYKEAVNDLLTGNNKREKDLNAEDIEKQAKKILEDKKSPANLKKQELDRYYKVFENQLGQLDVNDSVLQTKVEALFKNPKVKANIYSGKRIDLQGTTDANKLDQSMAKSLLVDNVVVGENTTINVAGLEPSDLASIETFENGMTTIVFDDDFLHKATKGEDGRTLTIEVKDIDGLPVTTTISPENNKITFFRDKVNVLDELVNMIDINNASKVHEYGDYEYTITDEINGQRKVNITELSTGAFHTQRVPTSIYDSNTALHDRIKTLINDLGIK